MRITSHRTLFSALLIIAILPFDTACADNNEKLFGKLPMELVSGGPVNADDELIQLGLELSSVPIPTAKVLQESVSATPLQLTKRGSKEISIHKKTAPAVVLIQGAGTCAGTLIDSKGTILTSWHCVREMTEIYVRLYPLGKASDGSRLIKAKVLKVAPLPDLALLRLAEVPQGVSYIRMGSQRSIKVGADVLSIGHPSGLFWSFAKGMISQVHQKYMWSPDPKRRHEAQAIQTQIPMYEGNSGGPLLSEDGALIGVNTAKREGEIFAFAVALDDIQKFITSSNSSNDVIAAITKAPHRCKDKFVATNRSVSRDATVVSYDIGCTGTVNAMLVIPDNREKPPVLATATGDNGRIDRYQIISREKRRITNIAASSDGKLVSVSATYSKNTDRVPSILLAESTN